MMMKWLVIACHLQKQSFLYQRQAFDIVSHTWSGQRSLLRILSLARTTSQKNISAIKQGSAGSACDGKHKRTIRNTEQIWGEAVTIYKSGVDLMFDEETEDELNIIVSWFMVVMRLNYKFLSIWICLYLRIGRIGQPNNNISTRVSILDNSSDFEEGSTNLRKYSPVRLRITYLWEIQMIKTINKINMIMDNHPDWKGVFRIGGKNTKGFVRLENYEKSNR